MGAEKALLVIITCVGLTQGANVLLVPYMFRSVILEHIALGQALKDRGHNVHILLDSLYANFSAGEAPTLEPILYTEPPGVTSDVVLWDRILSNVFGHDAAAVGQLEESALNGCERRMRNRDLIERVVSAEFDIAIVDGFEVSSCNFLLPYNLSIPYVYLFSYVSDLTIGVPSLPSFVSTAESSFVSPSTVWDVLSTCRLHFNFYSLYTRHYPLLDEFAPGVHSDLEILRGSELFLITRDHVLEPARPSLPNTVFLPGITTRPPVPLDPDIDSFLAAHSRVGFLSFGSMIDTLTTDMVVRLLDGLGAVSDVTFLVRVRASALSSGGKVQTPANVHAMPWLSQNSVLAHANVRLFITHCGNNGQYEAVYHGVPMIGFPLFGDQEHNCKRAATKGLISACFSVYDFTPVELADSVRDVMENPKYLVQAKRYRAMLRSMPLPRETAADWIEHVIEFGGQDLRSASQDMPLHKFLMLDIIFGAFIIAHVILCALWFCLCSTCFEFKRKSTKAKYE